MVLSDESRVGATLPLSPDSFDAQLRLCGIVVGERVSDWRDVCTLLGARLALLALRPRKGLGESEDAMSDGEMNAVEDGGDESFRAPVAAHGILTRGRWRWASKEASRARTTNHDRDRPRTLRAHARDAHIFQRQEGKLQ